MKKASVLYGHRSTDEPTVHGRTLEQRKKKLAEIDPPRLCRSRRPLPKNRLGAATIEAYRYLRMLPSRTYARISGE